LLEPGDDGLELGEGRLEVGCGLLLLSRHAVRPPGGMGPQFTSRVEKRC
jgi:hypothetical protein